MYVLPQIRYLRYSLCQHDMRQTWNVSKVFVRFYSNSLAADFLRGFAALRPCTLWMPGWRSLTNTSRQTERGERLFEAEARWAGDHRDWCGDTQLLKPNPELWWVVISSICVSNLHPLSVSKKTHKKPTCLFFFPFTECVGEIYCLCKNYLLRGSKIHL